MIRHGLKKKKCRHKTTRTKVKVLMISNRIQTISIVWMRRPTRPKMRRAKQ